MTDALAASVNLYDVLGVAPTATATDVKNAWRRVARETHPDVAARDPATRDRFEQARAAFAVLSDPARRVRYDEERARNRVRHVGEYLERNVIARHAVERRLPRVRGAPAPGDDLLTVVVVDPVRGSSGAPSRDAVDARIPADAAPRTSWRIRGAGSPGANNGPAGDQWYVFVDRTE